MEQSFILREDCWKKELHANYTAGVSLTNFVILSERVARTPSLRYFPHPETQAFSHFQHSSPCPHFLVVVLQSFTLTIVFNRLCVFLADSDGEVLNLVFSQLTRLNVWHVSKFS